MNIIIFFLLFIFIISTFIVYIPNYITKSGFYKKSIHLNTSLLIAISTLLLYSLFGNVQLLNLMFNEKQIQTNEMSNKIRPLLIKLKKEQLDMRIYLSEYPNDHVIWSNLGQSYFMVHNFKQARFSYVQALKLKPMNTTYLMNLITSNANLNKGILKNKDKLILLNFIIKDIKNTHAINLIALQLYKKNLFLESLILWKQMLINMNKKENIIKNDNKHIYSNIKNIILNMKKRKKLKLILYNK